ncbi:MAG: MgtC/SapB family protein [Firmicutes bacterium]|nr:MgtC/SapB family protein [Bacillota bacterium]
MPLEVWEIVLRLGLAMLLGGAVGLERESHNRPAGFRTHILVCVGSALLMIVSAYTFPPGSTEPSRIAAQVVTGIGFLGAGTILVQRGSIRGLTTAASIWVVSGIGLAVGIGFYTGALIATGIVLVTLLLFGRIDDALLSRRRFKRLCVRAVDQPGLMARVSGVLGDFKVNIRKVELSRPEYRPELQAEVIDMDFIIKMPLYLEPQRLFQQICPLQGVIAIFWQGEEIPMKAYNNFSVSNNSTSSHEC